MSENLGISNNPLELIASIPGMKITEIGALSDGSGFAVGSMPLRKDHWLYETTPDGFTPNPPYPLLAGGGSDARAYLEEALKPAIRYGIKASTMNGKEEDFDPDAMVRNVLNGTFGLHTKDGLCGDPKDAHLFDPEQPGQLKAVLFEALRLGIRDQLWTWEEIAEAMTLPATYARQHRGDTIIDHGASALSWDEIPDVPSDIPLRD